MGLRVGLEVELVVGFTMGLAFMTGPNLTKVGVA